MDSLEGIRVVDLTQFLSASYCGQILGDLGAEVIKIERPESGEVYRTYGPKFIGGEATSYLTVNRNKKSLAVNIKEPAGQEVLQRLITKADVFIENFRPGTLGKYGLDYPSLSKLNPGLVYCSTSGFGQTGPYASKGGFDLIAQGMSGLMHVTGEQHGPPVKVGYPVLDIGAGMYSAIGILAALQARSRSGKGQHVDVSLFETGVAWGMMAAVNYFADGTVVGRMGSASPQNAPYQAFTVKDGAFVVGTGNDTLWHTFCDIFGMQQLKDREEYRDNVSRVQNQEKLEKEIQEHIRDLTVSECIRRLDKAGIPGGPINTIEHVMNDPHVQAREMIVEFEHPKAGTVKNIACPIKMSGTPARVQCPPPALGEHSAELLGELGYSEEEIEKMDQDGVIGRKT